MPQTTIGGTAHPRKDATHGDGGGIRWKHSIKSTSAASAGHRQPVVQLAKKAPAPKTNKPRIGGRQQQRSTAKITRKTPPAPAKSTAIGTTPASATPSASRGALAHQQQQQGSFFTNPDLFLQFEWGSSHWFANRAPDMPRTQQSALEEPVDDTELMRFLYRHCTAREITTPTATVQTPEPLLPEVGDVFDDNASDLAFSLLNETCFSPSIKNHR